MLRRQLCAVTRGSAVGAALLPSTHQVRHEQFTRTSEVNIAARSFNKKKRDAGLKWMAKSTKEYVSEQKDKKREAAIPDAERPQPKMGTHVRRMQAEMKTVNVNAKEEYAELHKTSEKHLDNELERLMDRNKKKSTRLWEFFKRHGAGFFVAYVSAYLISWFALYSMLASNFVSKGAVLDMCTIFVSFDRSVVLKKIEEWDTFINLGFSFVINDMLEVLRLPFVIFIYAHFLPRISRRPRGSSVNAIPEQLWNRFAPEAEPLKKSVWSR